MIDSPSLASTCGPHNTPLHLPTRLSANNAVYTSSLLVIETLKFYSCILPSTMSSVANASLKHPCPICKTKFPDCKALKAHTGTKSLGSARAQQCNLCDQRFCSATALQQHQDAPAHDTMFTCNECKKSSRGKEARQNYQKAKERGNSKSLVGPVLIADSGLLVSLSVLGLY